MSIHSNYAIVSINKTEERQSPQEAEPACMWKQQPRFLLFISSNERCHTTDAPKRMSGTTFSNLNKIQSKIPEDQKSTTTQC